MLKPLEFIFPTSHMAVNAEPSMPEWCEEKIKLTKISGSPDPGAWRNDVTPYLVEPMQAYTDQGVRKLVIQASSQSGKTAFGINCVGYAVDVWEAPTMIVIPRDLDVGDYNRKRVKSMFQESLPDLMTGKEDDSAGAELYLKTCTVKTAGANSPAALASDSRQVVIYDEVNKYPKFSGKEANPLKLGSDRTIAYSGREKQAEISTPTVEEGRITQDMKRTDERRFFMQCPECKHYAPSSFKQEENPSTFWVRWPKDADHEDVKLLQLAWLECPNCQGRVEQHQKHEWLMSGVWCPKGYTVSPDGTIPNDPGFGLVVGYYIHGTMSPFMSWSDLAWEFLSSKDRPEDLMDFFNSKLGEVFKSITVTTERHHIKARRGGYESSEVHPEGMFLTAGVDVQIDHCWYVIRAWAKNLRSWLVKQGTVGEINELEELLFETKYQQIQGQAFQVRLSAMDSNYRTDEVYDFCMKHQELIVPIRGEKRLKGPRYSKTRLETNARGQILPGGLALYRLDTTYYKTRLNRLIHTKTGDPGEWHLPRDVSEEYMQHMVAEQKVKIRNPRSKQHEEEWQKVSESTPNHSWDCEVYAGFAADLLGISRMSNAEGHAVVRRRVISSGLS